MRAKLKTIRDQGLFHLDKRYALNLGDFVRKELISFEEKSALIQTAAEICNTLLENIKGEGRSIDFYLNDDARYILEALEKLRDR